MNHPGSPRRPRLVRDDARRRQQEILNCTKDVKGASKKGKIYRHHHRLIILGRIQRNTCASWLCGAWGMETYCYQLREHQIPKGRCCRYHPVQYPAARAQTRGGLKEGREGEENTVALKEQQKIPRRRRNEIGNADYIHKRTSVVLWWLQEKEREKRKTQIRLL